MFRILLYLIIGYFVYRIVSAFFSGFTAKDMSNSIRRPSGTDKRNRMPKNGQKGEYIDYEEVRE